VDSFLFFGFLGKPYVKLLEFHSIIPAAIFAEDNANGIPPPG
jgi:hypothetical protein